MAKEKFSGQVFTPNYLVCNILDIAHYNTCEVLKKHVMDNSCGDGAFLCEIVKRYCASSISQGKSSTLKNELETYIHGLELDTDAFLACLSNLNNTAKAFDIYDVKWDVRNVNSLKEKKYKGKMDYVIGNPPYVRVHNLEDNYDDVKSFSFADNGMTDLYLVFFEIGFDMLKKAGFLCYITPSSWLNSIAGTNLRNYIKQEKSLVELVDLEHYQPFNATTYTIISLFQKGIERDCFMYSRYDEKQLKKQEVESLKFDDVFIGEYMYLARLESLKAIKGMQIAHSYKYTSVKNGFATLNDRVFISKDFPFEQYVIPTLKASTGMWYKAFFPYDKKGKPLSKDDIFRDERVANYLELNKQKLLKEKNEEDFKDWYLFGRTQALKDVYLNKYAINTVIKDVASIKFSNVPAGSGLYSGLYILTDLDELSLKDVLLCEGFVEYVQALKKYKSGGYYTFSSRDLEKYLNHKLTEKYGQSRISKGNQELF